MENPSSTSETTKYILKCILAGLLGLPLVILGILMCATGFLIMIGIPVMMLGVAPLARLIKRRTKAILEWQAFDKEITELELEHPWKD